MLRFGRVLVVVAITVLLAAASTLAAQEQRGGDDAATPPAFSSDRVIVEWAAGASPAERRAARGEADVDFARDLGDRRFQLVETEPGQTPREAIRELAEDPAVAHAERDAYATELAIPDDPQFGKLWGLQNTGLGIDGFTGALPGADIDVGSAWERTVGAPATAVAVIDGGYRFEHPDLTNAAWTNPSETDDDVDNDGNGIVDDVHGADFVGADVEAPSVDGDPTDDDLFTSPGGHGVHTAGTIGAEGDNGVGITGVAPEVSILPLRVCSIRVASKTRGCPVSAMIEAVNYAGAKGARVANISLGGGASSTALANAIAINPQTLFVIAAGNIEFPDDERNNDIVPDYPCVYNPLAEGRGPVDNVICVAATDQADQLAGFSHFGPNSVDLGAPGTQILSTAQYRHFIKDDFEVDDLDLKWIDSGPDGGLVRTDEAPLASFGMGDSPGALPDPGSSRVSRSVPVAVPAGYRGCEVEYTRWGELWFEYIIDGAEFGNSDEGVGGRRTYKLTTNSLNDGGVVELSFTYDAPAAPQAGDGLWLDDVQLRCLAKVGEADGYRYASGTSMAAPHVTGAAALLFSLKPSATVTEVRQGLLGSVDPISSLAGKTTSGGRLDAGAALDLFDAVPPPAPTLSSTNPASPSKNNQPRLKGSAQRGTSVAVYANSNCSGSPVASGTAAQLAVPGIAVDVADATTTQLSVKATDLAPHTSTCSAPISYTENSDLVAPAPPQLTSTEPASPGSSGAPRIRGGAEVGSTVRVYAGPACAGSPIVSGSAAELDSPGLSVQVAEGVTATFSATATDESANTSTCSAPISYTRMKATIGPGGGNDGPVGPGGGGDPPPGPTCVVPKLIGKTLARAKAALAAASCKLGTVRKPRARKGRRRPLVVKSSTPAAGASPSSGKVNLTLGAKPKVWR